MSLFLKNRLKRFLNDIRTAERASVAVQLLHRDFPKIAVRLLFSLAACRWVGLSEG